MIPRTYLYCHVLSSLQEWHGPRDKYELDVIVNKPESGFLGRVDWCIHEIIYVHIYVLFIPKIS